MHLFLLSALVFAEEAQQHSKKAMNSEAEFNSLVGGGGRKVCRSRACVSWHPHKALHGLELEEGAVGGVLVNCLAQWLHRCHPCQPAQTFVRIMFPAIHATDSCGYIRYVV